MVAVAYPKAVAGRAEWVLNGGSPDPFWRCCRAGAQSWQTNQVRLLAVLCKGDQWNGQKKTEKRLDVHFLVGTPPYNFRDDVDVDFKSEEAVVALLAVEIDRSLGLRPYNVTPRGSPSRRSRCPLVTPTRRPTSNGAAQKMVRPTLPSHVDYVYINIDVSRGAPEPYRGVIMTYFKKYWQGGVNKSVGAVENLSYSGLGQWWGISGHGASG